MTAKRPHLHVDAVQGFGLARLRPRALGADSVAVSAHKLHGPRGAGALWLRPGARLAPLWVGGGQERGLRGGSENLPAIVGFGVAARQARAAVQDGVEERVAALRDRFEQAALGALAAVVPGVAPDGHGRAARAAHRLARLPGPARRAAAARPRGARRARVGRFGLRVAHRRTQPDAEGDRRRRPDGRAALLVLAPDRDADADAAVAALVDAARELSGSGTLRRLTRALPR